MKLDSDDGIVGVQLCGANDDVLLTTRLAKCIRFSITDIRVFKGRESTGVRGIRLAEGDEMVSVALLAGNDTSVAEARAYLRQASAARRAQGEATAEDIDGVADEAPDEVDEGGEEAVLSQERYAELGAREQFVLAVSEQGFGKRTSSYEYRTMGRGAQGVTTMSMKGRNSALVAGLPVEESDHLMLITNQGKTIRLPVGGISIQRRTAQGVTLFRLEEGERVVSVERIVESSGESEE